MTYLSVPRSTLEIFEAVQVNTGVLSLSLLPELGGKLNSLRDLRTGREWLWRNRRLSYRRVPHGSRAGWLELTLDADAVKAHLVPDDQGFFEPTPQWDTERSWDRLWS